MRVHAGQDLGNDIVGQELVGQQLLAHLPKLVIQFLTRYDRDEIVYPQTLDASAIGYIYHIDNNLFELGLGSHEITRLGM
jgi:hypothetical protein